MSDYQLWLGDCLEEMDRIEAGSVDMILADLPYGTTACKWDVVIPFEPLWKHYKRVIKRNGSVVLFGSEPFSSLLVLSNFEWFRYTITWIKDRPSNPALAQKRPLNYTEDLLVFYKLLPIFNPQFTKRLEENKRNNKNERFTTESSAKLSSSFRKTGLNDYCYPKNFIKVNVQRGLHPTQKPVALLEYLIKTYTNEGDLILDNTCGSGSTLEAAMRNKRRSIGIEKDAHYYQVASQRLERVVAELRGDLNHLPMFERAAA